MKVALRNERREREKRGKERSMYYLYWVKSVSQWYVNVLCELRNILKVLKVPADQELESVFPGIIKGIVERYNISSVDSDRMIM